MAPTYYDQEYPLGTPSVSGNNYTVDLMLKEPTRINNYISNEMLYGYFAERIFPNAGSVSGGALVFTQATANDLFPTRRAQEVAPGAEFPEVTFDRPEPRTKQVKKLGGKFRITDEARERNDLTAVRSESDKLALDIQDQLHSRALAELDASITEIGSAVQVTATSWADAAALTFNSTANNLLPATDFAELMKRAQNLRLGTMYNLWFVNPQEAMNFDIVYGADASAVLARYGVEMVSTPLVTAGSAYAIQEGKVGQTRYEQPLRTTTTREELKESDWVKSSIRYVFAVTNPYNAVKITGLAA